MEHQDDGIEELGVASIETKGQSNGIWCEQSVLPWRTTPPPNPPPSC